MNTQKSGNPFVDKLAAELDGWDLGSTDVERWVEYLPWAARLDSLSIPKYLDNYRGGWPSRSPVSMATLLTALTERAAEGEWDLAHGVGDSLALALEEAQDFNLLLARLPWLPGPCQVALRAWVDAAECVDPDEDALDALSIYLDQFPIPDDERIEPLVAPVSARLCSLAEFVQSGRRVTFERWPRRTNDPVPPVVATPAEAPSPALCSAFEQHYYVVPLEAGRVVIRHLVLTDRWQVLIDIETERPVQFVALGSRLARRRAAQDHGRWIVELKEEGTEPLEWIAALSSPFVIIFVDGTELEFPGLMAHVTITS